MSSRPATASFRNLLGCFTTLEIRRFGGPGAFLTQIGAPSDAPTILLLGPEIPLDAREGDHVDVFVALDSDGRPLATTKTPRVALGEVAFLAVTACTDIGAFVDWGLAKELLVPFAEQTVPLRVGDRHPIGLYLDDSDRLAGTMRVRELLGADGKFHRDEWVEGEAWRLDPEIGLFVILERRFLGLVPRHEPHALQPGDAARFRVTRLHPDGKIELSLRGKAHEELGRDADAIMKVLDQPGAPQVGDRSAPEEIRHLFGLSKKAFKRALGTLLRAGRVDIDRTGRVHLLKHRP